MPQSQLGDPLAKHQWFWVMYRTKLRIKSGSSEPITIMSRKATYPTIIG